MSTGLTLLWPSPSAAWRIQVEVLEEGKRIALAEDQTAVATGRLGIEASLSEVVGFLAIPEDIPTEKHDVLYLFYDSFKTSAELLEKYRDLIKGIASLTFLAGFCYTQLREIEQEVNGLLTTIAGPKSPGRNHCRNSRGLL